MIRFNALRLLCLNDSGHHSLRERCCRSKKLFGFCFVDVALKQFVYFGVIASGKYRKNLMKLSDAYYGLTMILSIIK